MLMYNASILENWTDDSTSEEIQTQTRGIFVDLNKEGLPGSNTSIQPNFPHSLNFTSAKHESHCMLQSQNSGSG